jgi:hypothetical protein
MGTAEQIYKRIHKDPNIESPERVAQMMAFDYSIDIPYKLREIWYEVYEIIYNDWEELTGGMETAELTTYSDADAGL